MYAGTLRIRLLIRESRSLKDKRQVVRSIMDRLRNSFNISIAEVAEEDHRQMVVLGVAMVSREAHQTKEVFEKIVAAMRVHPVAEFVSHESEGETVN